MRLVCVDPEPPSPHGGGIRAYLRLVAGLCRRRGAAFRAYTHNPGAYPGEDARPIGRRPWLPAGPRHFAYRYFYHENVLWEHARWLADECLRLADGDTIFEFADFLGYGYFALRHPRLAPSCLMRLHTPAFLIPSPAGRLARASLHWREAACLGRARRIAAPSARFVREMLPGLRNWIHVPNPLPPPPPRRPPRPLPPRFLYLGRLEERKGILVLLEAFLRLARRRPEARLDLAGAWADADFRSRAEGLLASRAGEAAGRVRFLPPVTPEERERLWDGYGFLVLPSLWENSPYALFEGMGAGLACLAARTGEMAEAMDAVGGRTFAPGDAAGLEAALEDALGRPDAGAAQVEAQYRYLKRSAAAAEERLWAGYLEILGRGGRG